MAERTVLSATEKRENLRALLSRDTLSVMPGGFSPIFAMMAEQLGFESFFFAGSQMSAFLFGVPDLGILGLHDVVAHGGQAAGRSNIPIMLDCDTGYGNALNVHFAVGEIVRSGVAAMSLEDQEAPKKSATSAGRRLVSRAEAVGKLQAAVDAREAIDKSFVLCARCDSLGAENEQFSDALDRCIGYVSD